MSLGQYQRAISGVECQTYNAMMNAWLAMHPSPLLRDQALPATAKAALPAEGQRQQPEEPSPALSLRRRQRPLLRRHCPQDLCLRCRFGKDNALKSSTCAGATVEDKPEAPGSKEVRRDRQRILPVIEPSCTFFRLLPEPFDAAAAPVGRQSTRGSFHQDEDSCPAATATSPCPLQVP
jgi:hypothetical protein